MMRDGGMMKGNKEAGRRINETQKERKETEVKNETDSAHVSATPAPLPPFHRPRPSDAVPAPQGFIRRSNAITRRGGGGGGSNAK